MRFEKRHVGLTLALSVLWLGFDLSPVTRANANPAAAEGRVVTDLDSQAAFERLKGLVGEWKGTWEPGSVPTTVTYTLTGNGSALIEDYAVAETTMATIYHLDGDDLMLTHYCSIGNQPRMRAASMGEDFERIQFDFIDVTNLESGGYSERLVVSMLEENRISLRYTGSRTGRTSGVELERVR